MLIKSIPSLRAENTAVVDECWLPEMSGVDAEHPNRAPAPHRSYPILNDF